MGAVEKGVSLWQMSMLYLAIFVDVAGFGIIIPLLPFFAQDELGASDFQYGIILAIYSLTQFIFAPIWGRVSDRIGRRPIILIGVFGSSIGFIMFALANSIPTLIISRAISGFFTSATLTVSNAYIADSTTNENRTAAFGLLGAAFSLGFATGPAIGGILSKIRISNMPGHVFPALFAAGLSLINFIGAIFLLPESMSEELKLQNKNAKSTNSVPPLSKVIKLEGVILLISIFVITNFAFSNFIAAFGIFSKETDHSIDSYKLGIVYSYVGVLSMIVQGGVVNYLTHNFKEEFIIFMGSIFTMEGMFLIAYSRNMYAMLVAVSPMIVGIALINPTLNSAISSRVPANVQGSVMGLNQGLGSLMRIVGPLLATTLLSINLKIPFLFASFLYLLILIIILIKFDLQSGISRELRNDSFEEFPVPSLVSK